MLSLPFLFFPVTSRKCCYSFSVSSADFMIYSFIYLSAYFHFSFFFFEQRINKSVTFSFAWLLYIFLSMVKNNLLTNLLVDEKELGSNVFMVIKILITCIMDLYHWHSCKCLFSQKEKFVYGMFRKMSRRIGPITDSSSILFIVSVQELKDVSIFVLRQWLAT